MIENRVAALRLRIRTGEPGPHRLRPAAEQFTRNVLDRFAEVLEARMPGRMVFIYRLPIHWRLSERALHSPSAIGKAAEDLVTAVENAARRAPKTPPSPNDEFAVFEDEAHWRACHLIARARRAGADAWCYTELRQNGGPILSMAESPSPGLTMAVLVRLADEAELPNVLASLSPEELAILWRSGSFDRPPQGAGDTGERDVAPSEGQPPGEPAARPREGADRRADRLVEVERLLGFARSLPVGLSATAVRIALHVEARRILGPAADADAVSRVVDEVLAALGLASPPAARPEEPRPAAGPAETAEKPRERADAGPVESPQTEPRVAGRWETRFGGLFYLLTPALEMGVGEVLWKACLPEGRVFAHATSALLGRAGAGDPAPELFGGVGVGAPLPSVAPEHQEDVARMLLSALGTALPRRGLAEFPETVLGLVNHASGRLLVAAARGSPFAIFAWPADTPSAASAGLKTFLDNWTRSAPRPRASGGLVQLDPTGRLQTAAPSGLAPTIFLPPGESPHAVALLAQTIGVLCHLFDARAADEPPTAPAAFVEQYLRVPGEVHLDSKEMTVVMPMEHVDPEVRLAGLDRDPAWVPWLQRTVRFVF